MWNHASAGALCRLVSLVVAVTALAGPAAFAGPEPETTAMTRVVRVPLNDGLTPRHLATLAEQSSTARDLLASLERVPDAVFLVRAHPLLVQNERLLGRGRFWVVGHRLFGLLEYQAAPAGSARALRVLAHELAHALEVGMLPRGRTTDALRPNCRCATSMTISSPHRVSRPISRAP